MKIALVSPYDFSHPGGVTEHIVHLIPELRRRGADVKLMAPASGELPAEIEEGEDFYRIGRAFPIPANGSIARITMSFHLSRWIGRILEREKFDLIHYHEPLAPALPVTVLRASHTCNVGTFHAYAKSSSAYYYGRRLLRRYHRKLHGRIAVSEPAREFVGQYFPAQYSVVPNGVDAERFHPGVTPLPQFRDGKINILFVGRLEKRKGLGTLLRAYIALKRRSPELRLIVVGDGRMRRGYEEYIKRHRVPDVVMAGYVSPEELPRYHASADIFCAPNTGKESFGIVLLEAMAAGLPVVATDIPGFVQVVSPGRQGMLARRDDPISLASALNLLALDPELRQRMAAAGRATALQYSWANVVDKVVGVYAEALDRYIASTFNPLELLTPAEERKRRYEWSFRACAGDCLMFSSGFTTRVRAFNLGIAQRFAHLPVSPNQVTVAGLLVTIVAAVLVGLGDLFAGGLVLLFAGAFDMLDGALARARAREHVFGALLDSIIDRFSEGVIMLALLIYFLRHEFPVAVVLVLLATFGSLMVSYVKARAEGLGLKVQGGWLQRPERVLLTVGGLLASAIVPALLLAVLVVLAVFTNVTAIQRVWLVWREVGRPE